jgi:protein-S-isoprenylcysteine O-methyltransferase
VLATVAEHALEAWAAPRLKAWLCALRWLGFGLAAAGQALRTAAMVAARDAFSHQIAEKREPGHRLVTTGLYGRVRHPSYLGFLLWTAGIQLLMGNPLCLAAFLRILLRFFRERVAYEEATLLRFFPDAFPPYRAAVWSGFCGIP